MAEFTLNAEVRTQTGKGDSRRLRMKGLVPAVIYGPGVTPVHISLSRSDLEKTLQKARRNSIMKIAFGGRETDREVIIRDHQKDPLTRLFTHVDFQAIDLRVPIKVEVDLNLVGEPIGKKSGAILTTQLRTLRIECLPSKIPAKIDLDVSALDVGDSLHVSDLPKSEFKIISNPNLTICQMSIVKEEVVAAPVAAAEPGAEGAAAAAPDAAAATSATTPAAPAAAPKKESK